MEASDAQPARSPARALPAIRPYRAAFGSMITPAEAACDLADVQGDVLGAELRQSGFVALRGFANTSPDELVALGRRAFGRPVRHFQVDQFLRTRLTADALVASTPSPLPFGLSWLSRTCKHLAGWPWRPDRPDLHAELAYTPARPDVVCFIAIRPSRPGRGGATAICDGRELLRQLSPDTVRLFRERRLKYTIEPDTKRRWTFRSVSHLKRRDDSGILQYGYTGERTAEGTLRLVHVTDAIVRDLSGEEAFCNSMLSHPGSLTFEDGSRVPPEVMLELRETSARVHVAHEYQVNDVLILDNRRFMHEGAWNTDPYRLVAMAMFDLS
jgi:hypothetical protein